MNNSTVSVTCPNCGALLVGSSRSMSIKCHWCHTVISADKYIDNPRLPDRLLPFSITKEDAIKKIDQYLADKKEFAKKDFLDNYNLNEIIPVYLPYMLVDIKAHSVNTGTGEKNIPPPSNEWKKRRYYINISKVVREFDLNIDDLIIESSNSNSFDSVNATSNVISAVSPFDTENSIQFNVNFLNGFSAENRELDIDLLNSKIPKIVSDIAEDIAEKNTNDYDRGVSWNDSTNNIISTNWSSALLPVWLYSYYEKDSSGNKTYYIAVNGRTGKTIGSIPFEEKRARNTTKLKAAIPFLIVFLVISIIMIFYAINMFQAFSYASDRFMSMIIFIVSITVFSCSLFWYFKFYSKFDSIREKYTSNNKKIDYIKDSKYKHDNDINKDESIRNDWTDLAGKKNVQVNVTIISD